MTTKVTTEDFIKMALEGGRKFPDVILVQNAYWRTSSNFNAGYHIVAKDGVDVKEIHFPTKDDVNIGHEVKLVIIPEKVGAFVVIEHWDWEGTWRTTAVFTGLGEWRVINTNI